MDVQTWYLKTSKLALALAIIHSKPADRSSREYTEHLATLVAQKEPKCQSKVEALEAEVLQLRQQLFLSRISSGLFKNGHDVFPAVLPDQEPTSSENTLALMDDSGCVLSNEQRSEPAELSQHWLESCSPPSLLPLPLENKPYPALDNPPSSHMQFLQHLLELKKLTESSSLKIYLAHFEKDSSIVSESVLKLLDGLITFYRNPKLPSSSFWTQAVGTLARLASDFNLSNHILKKCSKKLEEFEKTLLQAIIGNSSINRFQVQHYVSQSLVTLGSCSVLRKSIILLLLSEVNSFVDHLGAINQDQGSYDVTRYENIFSLFWILEQLLQQEIQGDPALHIDHSSPEIQTFLQKHDETIFRLSDAFPLFTFYLWRLGILLNSAEMETVEKESFP
ncbi:meiosis-specific protein MEI4 isoform X1 [Cricetulus griseus]|uniref:Meiosis-specific protein MEI4 isoform X1 n=1 Tax=Cricetulus griseus TaxID=10029 RepID=A0A8C2MBU8_CRIGR|nr:meiosis-specific protein MEI4 isoform X1 [Cricetulus griseus]XP_035317353.1 meiosis-specific protein MEI4 isoform X1 [Cricetulus griseus]